MIRAHSALLAVGLLAAACGDEGATGNSKTPDMGPTGGTEVDASGGTGGTGGVGGAVGGAGGTGGVITPDAALPDAALPDAALPDAALPDMNVVLPDVALPDAALPDAYMPTSADAGAACEPQDPAGVCGPFSKCVDAICRPELVPDVFRMTAATIVAPGTAADALSAAIQVALSTSPPAINLLIEPYSYSEDGYRFNVGNGRALVPGAPDSDYVFNHTLPIQNIYGEWLYDQGTLRYEQAGNGRFTIFAPGRQVMNAGGQNVTCWNEIGATVQVTVEPRRHDDGTLYVHAVADGFMSVDDANAVVFYVGNSPIPLSGFLLNEPIVDADLDGTENEYFFNIEIDADRVTLNDASLARDPEQIPEQDPACENR